MLKFPTRHTPGLPHPLVLGVLLIFFFSIAMASAASAYVDKSVQWAASPLVNALGQPLPPAVSYEVWVRPEGQTEYLAATVNVTTYTLRATYGVSYYVRVRGISALGLKSAFSEYSAPYRASEVSGTPPAALVAGFGPTYPNPFNARTTIAYSVPEDPAATASLGLEIFDVRGRRLRVFELDSSPGAHEVSWDGRDDSGSPVPAGMYIARYVCGAYTARTKMTLLP